MEKEQTGASPAGSGYSGDAPSPQAVSAFGEYPSRGPSDSSRPSADYQDGFNTANERADERIRELEAEVAQLDGRLTDAVLDKALMAKRIRELKAEVARLTERLINGPANMQECAEFCRIAREDGDGKPCLDCHPECFHF